MNNAYSLTTRWNAVRHTSGEAMIDEIDNGGMKDAGVIKYSYAHPLFWAPFVLVGD